MGDRAMKFRLWPQLTVLMILVLIFSAGPVSAAGLYNQVETMGGSPWAKTTLNLDMADQKVIISEDIQAVKPQIQYYSSRGRVCVYCQAGSARPSLSAALTKKSYLPLPFVGDQVIEPE